MRKLSALLVLSLSSFGCGDGGSSAPAAATAESTTPGVSTVLKKNLRARPTLRSAQSAGRRAVSSAAPLKVDQPVGGDVVAAIYPEAGVPTIDAGCKDPWAAVEVASDQPGVVLATLGQIFLANPAFKLVDAKPERASEVQVSVYVPGAPGTPAPVVPLRPASPGSSGAPSAGAAKPPAPSAKPATSAASSGGAKIWVVARCHDAGTCTRTAAMLKAVAKWTPTAGCGEPPGVPTTPATILPAPATPADPVAACARLGACKLASEPASTDDPIGACQKAASSFKTECASKPTCADVIACQK